MHYSTHFIKQTLSSIPWIPFGSISIILVNFYQSLKKMHLGDLPINLLHNFTPLVHLASQILLTPILPMRNDLSVKNS